MSIQKAPHLQASKLNKRRGRGWGGGLFRENRACDVSTYLEDTESKIYLKKIRPLLVKIVFVECVKDMLVILESMLVMKALCILIVDVI